MGAELLEQANASTEKILANVSRDQLGSLVTSTSGDPVSQLAAVAGRNPWRVR